MTRIAFSGGLLLLELAASAVSLSEITITSLEAICGLTLPAVLTAVSFAHQAGDVLFAQLTGNSGEAEEPFGAGD